jgi:release factor glutamine methyltransferase
VSAPGTAAAARGPESWKPLDLVRWTAAYFGRHGVTTPRLDAEVLLAHVLGCQRIDLYVRFEQPVEVRERERFRALIQRRALERMPVAYLTGEREFWSRSFAVTPAVLVPRPETETLVRAALDRAPLRALDFGTGSGVIAAAVALESPATQLWALDRSRAALAVAAANLARHGLRERVSLVCADRLSALRARFDLIVANPPYVATSDLERVAPELRHEPRVALDGGADGLDVVRRLIDEAPARLSPGGWLLLEIGAGQAQRVEALLGSAGATSREVIRDLAGIERVVAARFGEALAA